MKRNLPEILCVTAAIAACSGGASLDIIGPELFTYSATSQVTSTSPMRFQTTVTIRNPTTDEIEFDVPLQSSARARLLYCGANRNCRVGLELASHRLFAPHNDSQTRRRRIRVVHTDRNRRRGARPIGLGRDVLHHRRSVSERGCIAGYCRSGESDSLSQNLHPFRLRIAVSRASRCSGRSAVLNNRS